MKRQFIRMLLCGIIVTNGILFHVQSQERKTMFNHIALSVYDLKKSAAFYQEVMQLDTIPEPFKVGKHVWFSIAPGFSLHLVAGATELKDHDRNTHICFSVVDISAFIERLNQYNVPYYDVQGLAGRITVRVDGVQQIYFRDPDGYWLEVNDEKR